ncbi:DUF7130 family rubredoxin-like protein [Desulfofundulus australicus]
MIIAVTTIIILSGKNRQVFSVISGGERSMKWRCGVCGYIHDGDQPPEKCPKCGAPREKFIQLTEEEAGLIERSRFSNDLHARLIALMQKVELLADEGIKDNLDPGCLTVFRAAKNQARILARMARAEIQTHISKGKWG